MTHIFLSTKTSAPHQDFIKDVDQLGVLFLHAPVLRVEFLSPEIVFPFPAVCMIVSSQYALDQLDVSLLPKTIKIFCVGHSVYRALERKGYRDNVSMYETAEHLVQDIETSPEAFSDIFFPRGADVHQDFKAVCTRHGISLYDPIVYRTHPVSCWPQEVLDVLHARDAVTIGVYSAQGARALSGLIDAHNLESTVIRTKLLCLSDRMLKYLSNWSWKACFVSIRPTRKALLEMLKHIHTMECSK